MSLSSTEEVKVVPENNEDFVIVSDYKLDIKNKDLNLLEREGGLLNDNIIDFRTMQMIEKAHGRARAAVAAPPPTSATTTTATKTTTTTTTSPQPKVPAPKTFVFATTFWKKLTEDDGLNKVKRWTRKLNLLSDFKRLLVPMNLGNSHWVLTVIDVEKRELLYMDSLRQDEASLSDLDVEEEERLKKVHEWLKTKE